MLVDELSIALKTLMYLALLQAAGSVFYLATFESRLKRSLPGVRVIALAAALSCIVLTVLYTGFQAARMAGDLSGIVDGHLQWLVWHSTTGASASLRIVALTLVYWYRLQRYAPTGVIQLTGATGAVLSLLLVGHTSVNDERWLLAPLLAAHLIVAAWWFGSLIPLALASRWENTVTSLLVVNQFSRIAGWLVPGLALAGLGIALILTAGRYSVRDPYDLALTGKVFGFSVLMCLATLNRWRLGPRLATGNPNAIRSFAIIVAAEYVIIVAVVSLTAALTSLYSPEAL